MDRDGLKEKTKPAMNEAGMAIFWPTPGFKGKTFDNSELSPEETLISTSTVPHRGSTESQTNSKNAKT